MILIDDDNTTIHLTRGDATNNDYYRLAVQFPIYNYDTEEEELYEFQTTDKLRFTAFDKKGYTKKEIFSIEKTISELGYTDPTTTPELVLTSEDTKKFPLENKRKTYWYDLVLNDTTTIIGMDDEGAKKIIVYPEAEEE